ncbi:MAG: cytochrome c maturation protein CcmE [Bacteroidetes bacterium]|nr:cytochrome c maturation protein CcmE [Bacteroidota bacterium]MCW5896291.1 cytochrome c maturation protein CcmE [Bacteroidota bacterium]
MKPKVIVASVIIVAFIIFGSYSFLESNVEYTDVAGAMKSQKKVQLKGEWLKEKESGFDVKTSTFTFYLKDESGRECKVVLDGAAPNNFELALSVVAKGRYMADENYFHATEVLTKCPSKYEAQADEVKKNV